MEILCNILFILFLVICTVHVGLRTMFKMLKHENVCVIILKSVCCSSNSLSSSFPATAIPPVSNESEVTEIDKGWTTLTCVDWDVRLLNNTSLVTWCNLTRPMFDECQCNNIFFRSPVNRKWLYAM